MIKNYVLIIKCLKLGLVNQFLFFKDLEVFYLQKQTEDQDPKKRKHSNSTAKSDNENQTK